MTPLRKQAMEAINTARGLLAAGEGTDDRQDAQTWALIGNALATLAGETEKPQNETNSVSPVREPVCEHFHLTKTDDGWILQRGDWPPIELADDDQLFHYIAAARNRAVYGQWMKEGK